MGKVDIEAKLFMWFLHLKEEQNKVYTEEECEKNIAYTFNNFEEFKQYFLENGLESINNDLLCFCKIKTTQKGTVIALKGLCDHVIRKQLPIKSNIMIKK